MAVLQRPTAVTQFRGAARCLSLSRWMTSTRSGLYRALGDTGGSGGGGHLGPPPKAKMALFVPSKTESLFVLDHPKKGQQNFCRRYSPQKRSTKFSSQMFSPKKVNKNPTKICGPPTTPFQNATPPPKKTVSWIRQCWGMGITFGENKWRDLYQISLILTVLL